jgi:hypothetical protein
MIRLQNNTASASIEVAAGGEQKNDDDFADIGLVSASAGANE